MGVKERYWRRAVRLGVAGAMLAGVIGQPAAAEENMRFHGTLVAEPCVIPPGEEEIQLDFGTIVDKYLYLNIRTHSQSFALHLAECDLSLGNTVSITFSGTENAKLPGLLALDGGSSASGGGDRAGNSRGQSVAAQQCQRKIPAVSGEQHDQPAGLCEGGA